MVCFRTASTHCKLQFINRFVFSFLTNSTFMSRTSKRFSRTNFRFKFFRFCFIIWVEEYCNTLWMIEVTTICIGTLEDLEKVRQEVWAAYQKKKISYSYGRCDICIQEYIYSFFLFSFHFNQKKNLLERKKNIIQ